MQERRREEEKRREEAEAAAQAAAGKKPVKAPAGKDKKVEAAPVEEDVVVNMDEEETQELIEVIAEPEYTKVDGSDRAIALKTSCVIDYANYTCDVK
jgi:predicted component of type VI protein secretion system